MEIRLILLIARGGANLSLEPTAYSSVSRYRLPVLCPRRLSSHR